MGALNVAIFGLSKKKNRNFFFQKNQTGYDASRYDTVVVTKFMMPTTMMASLHDLLTWSKSPTNAGSPSSIHPQPSKKPCYMGILKDLGKARKPHSSLEKLNYSWLQLGDVDGASSVGFFVSAKLCEAKRSHPNCLNIRTLPWWWQVSWSNPPREFTKTH